MRLAYVISAYRNPQQLQRLVDRLTDPDVTFYIHIDLKTRGAFKRFIEYAQNRSDIKLLPSHRVAWGSFGHVLASIKGIASATLAEADFSHLILLTGQDYPVKSNDKIKEFFSSNPDSSFMEHFELPWKLWDHERGGLDRFERIYLPVAGRKLYRVPLLTRKFPDQFQPYGGSSYWCLNRCAAEYVAKFVTEQREFVKFFRTVKIPDELFFQTVLMNSPLKDQIINDTLRFTRWQEGSPHPETLTGQDYSELKNSPALFARKFDTEQDVSILDRIDTELLGV